MDTLGKRIAYYRKLQGLSQEKVAEHIGISRQAVTKWENDNSRPNTDNLLQLSALFEIPLNELVSSYSEDHSPEEKATRIDENGLLRNRMRIIIPIFLFTCGM
ncbi:DNA-binding helix-turn-helix protein, partial [Hungatella hathewayi DSM 13479]